MVYKVVTRISNQVERVYKTVIITNRPVKGAHKAVCSIIISIITSAIYIRLLLVSVGMSN